MPPLPTLHRQQQLNPPLSAPHEEEAGAAAACQCCWGKSLAPRYHSVAATGFSMETGSSHAGTGCTEMEATTGWIQPTGQTLPSPGLHAQQVWFGTAPCKQRSTRLSVQGISPQIRGVNLSLTLDSHCRLHSVTPAVDRLHQQPTIVDPIVGGLLKGRWIWCQTPCSLCAISYRNWGALFILLPSGQTI